MWLMAKEMLKQRALCQRNRSHPFPQPGLPGSAYNPLEEFHSIQICPQVIRQGHHARLKAVLQPQPQVLVIRVPLAETFSGCIAGSPDEGLASWGLTYVEVLASHRSRRNRPSVSGCQSRRSSGIREMGWFNSEPCAMCCLTLSMWLAGVPGCLSQAAAPSEQFQRLFSTLLSVYSRLSQGHLQQQKGILN